MGKEFKLSIYYPEEDKTEYKDVDVREIRQLLGMTLKEFSEKFHMPMITLQGWESGRRHPPEHVLFMICRILELEGELREIKENGLREEDR